MEDDNSAISRYIERIDRETANRVMQQAGEHFGFPTVEIEGVFRTSSGHLSQVFGYKKPFGLQKLLASRGIYGIKMAGFLLEVASKIRDQINLSSKDSSSILYDWPAFLIGGMNSTNEEARAVQVYLLKAERVARIGVVAVRSGALAHPVPDPAIAAIRARLASEAWRGNPLSAYLLENEHHVPVTQLLNRTEPGLSELAGTIAQYLQFIGEDNLIAYGVDIRQNECGYSIEGTPQELYTTFLETSRRHKLPRFFGNTYSFGSILAREADALEVLGWRRSFAKKTQGNNHYRYEQVRILTEN